MDLEHKMKRKNVAQGENHQEEEDNWVYDSSVDFNGGVPLRASTGVWKASLFIIALEFSERLSFFGIASNLITYLTKVIHQDLKTAAQNVNLWTGVTTVMPLIGGFLADSYTGRFTMVLISSLIYLTGLSLLTISHYVPTLKPPRKIHEVVMFLGLYCISVGTGGHKPCLESFGADQFDDDHSEERKKKMSFFNWWNCGLCLGLLLGATVIVYVEDRVSWGVAELMLTINMAIAVVIFYIGRPFYRYRVAQGSPLTPMFQVLVAALRKRNLPCPSSVTLLYEVPKSKSMNGRLLCHTNRFGFLDKAAIVEEDEHTPNFQRKENPWKLATVTKVEEVKLILIMIPIWLTALPFGVCFAQTSTFFTKQATTLNLNVIPNFKIPPASIVSLAAVGMITSVTIYDKILVPYLRKTTGNERGISILQRIGIGMVFSIASMSVAALVERKRLELANNNELGSLASMSVFWLAPQSLILGLGDGFAMVGLQEYFYDQVPDSMRSLGIAFFLSIIGVGSFLSSFLISVVDSVTEISSGKSWFGNNLNVSRLDNFYWLLAAVNVLNLCLFVTIAKGYTYKTIDRKVVVAKTCSVGNDIDSEVITTA
ncbi:hypothetical protein FNV43_RR24725 [Rhamnella rubrinervis]|uniref:Uncharacterized protein n=1 Tax=Rhamnella rubrinervis TaxID=2594499 RepID=A0A8K0DM26_9ROSA|nr:hypothetical protein FNV43_RR24725 [Rhamnella rubrinervis]